MQKELLVKKDYAGVGEEISHEMAADFIRTYTEAYPNDILAFHMGKTILERILAQPGCAGIRFYNGINEKGQKTLVYIGIDAEGKDIIKRTVVHEDGSISTINGVAADRNGNDTGTVGTGITWWNPLTWF
jgi:hypothetical protein